MLENIKLMLGLIDDKYDEKIEFYIKRVSKNICMYCNIKEVPLDLEDAIEDKVYNIMTNILASDGVSIDGSVTTPTSNNNIKSITRGDTKIEYNTDSSTSSSSNSSSSSDNPLDFTVEEKKKLNKFRKFKW